MTAAAPLHGARARHQICQSAGHINAAVIPVLQVRRIAFLSAKGTHFRAGSHRAKHLPKPGGFGVALALAQRFQPPTFFLCDYAVLLEPAKVLEAEVGGHTEVLIAFTGAGVGDVSAAHKKVVLGR